MSLILLAPLFWMVSTALKGRKQIFTYPPEWLPDPAIWSNFSDSLSAYPFGRFATNTLIIAGFNIAGVLLTASMAAYAFARLRFPGRDVIFMILLSTLMLPFSVLMIPRYIEFRELGWLDSWLPLIVPNWFGGSVFFIFLLRQFFRPYRVT
ncbi:MAG: carbohydrate ABC transporter permease [Thermomicrobiales bacterium]